MIGNLGSSPVYKDRIALLVVAQQEPLAEQRMWWKIPSICGSGGVAE